MVRGDRIDGNQKEIVASLRKAGYYLYVTSAMKHGFPDLMVVSKSGITVLMELKMPGCHLTPDEEKFMAECGAIYHVCYSPDDALEYMAGVDRMRIR